MISFAGQKEKLPKEQREDIVTMFQCMDRAVDLLAEELYEDKSQRILNYEKQSEELRLKYLFDRIWYRDVCSKLKEFPSEKLQDFINNKLKSNEQIKPVFSSISHIIKEREIKPADVSVQFHDKSPISPFFVFSISKTLFHLCTHSIQPMPKHSKMKRGKMLINLCKVCAHVSIDFYIKFSFRSRSVNLATTVFRRHETFRQLAKSRQCTPSEFRHSIKLKRIFLPF